MHAILYGWPYFGLVLALALTAWLVFAPRAPDDPPRWRDPLWLMRLLWPMYLLHQFEEHGIDLLGRHYAFLAGMCTVIGFPSVENCPADAGYVFAVNVIGCWIDFSLPFLVGRRRPLIAACAWGIPLVNAMTHLSQAVLRGGYNPGTATSAVLFLPLGTWMLVTAVRSGVIRAGQVPRVFASGVAVHVVLIGSLLLREHGLPYAILLALNGAIGFIPLLFGRAPVRPEVGAASFEALRR